MSVVAIPVLLSVLLGPGMGQFYNKEYKKGAILVVVSLVVLIVAGMWYFKNLQPYIPADVTQMDPLAMQQIMTNAAGQISAKDGKILAVFEALLTVLWIYGIVDAYRGAKRKNANGGTV